MLIGQVSSTWHVDRMRLFWSASNIQILSNYCITEKKINIFYVSLSNMVLLRQNQLKIEGKTSKLDDTFFPSKFQKNCRGTVLLNGTITPSEELIDQFQEWNKTKTGEKRLVSYNRAKQWIYRLLKKEVSIPPKVIECDRKISKMPQIT